jgi:hypothetical protein
MNIRGFCKICNLNKIDVLITDDGIDVETKMRLEEIGIMLDCQVTVVSQFSSSLLNMLNSYYKINCLGLCFGLNV